MQNNIHPHKPPKPKARKPHVQPPLPPPAQNGKAARTPNNGSASAHQEADTSEATNEPTIAGFPLKAEQLALLVIQREVDNSWRWTAYTRKGARLAYQDHCEDTAAACLQALAYLNDVDITEQASAPAQPQHQAKPARRPRASGK